MIKAVILRGAPVFSLFVLIYWDSWNRRFETQNLNGQEAESLKDFEDAYKDTDMLQAERRQQLSNYCNQRKLDDIIPAGANITTIPAYHFRNIIVNDQYQLLYCFVPKAACSNWKKVLAVLNGVAKTPWDIPTHTVHNRSLGYFRYLNEYENDEIVHRLNTYYKFMFVRNPFERLVSAYRNKFVQSYDLRFFQKLYGRHIIRHYRNKPDKKALRTGEGVSFLEFVQFLLNSKKEFMDRHWKPYDSLCNPCLVYYDFVGKFETLKSDAEDLLRILEIEDKVQFPHNITSNYPVKTSRLARDYFETLPEDIKNRLYNLLYHDLKMFGYTRPEYV